MQRAMRPIRLNAYTLPSGGDEGAENWALVASRACAAFIRCKLNGVSAGPLTRFVKLAHD